MGVIYSILEALIPFEFIDYAFMKNALIAIILVTPVFAILGTMIVNNKMAFFSDALGHSALTGIALGMILGISNMNVKLENDKIYVSESCYIQLQTDVVDMNHNMYWEIFKDGVVDQC